MMHLQKEFPVMTPQGIGLAYSCGSNVGTKFYTVKLISGDNTVMHESEFDRLVTESEMAFEVARAVIRSVNEVVNSERHESMAEGWHRMAEYCKDMADLAKIRKDK